MAGSQAPELVPQSPAVQGPCQRRPTAGRAQPHGLGRQASSWTPGTAAREPSSPQSGCSQAPAALAGRCRGQGEGWRGAPGERPPDSPPPALHSWPSSLFSVTLGPNRLALDACESTSSVEELLLSPGGPEGSGPGGLALARLERPPSLSSAVQPVSLATGPQPSPWPKLCWAQGFDLDFDPYIPPKELHSVPLKPLDVSSCKDAFRLQPDCPDLKVSLPKGSQCTRLPYSYSKLVVRISALPRAGIETHPPPQSFLMPLNLGELGLVTLPPAWGLSSHNTQRTGLAAALMATPEFPGCWGDSPFRSCLNVGQPLTQPGFKLLGAPWLFDNCKHFVEN
nr:uncharacterized protein LOC123276441 isoform X1 [Equus asinus]